MTEAEASIRVSGVGKVFRIPLDRPATLKHRVLHPRSTTRFRNFEALHDVSFDVAPGEFLGIIGHNGSGKSTLLKIMSGIYTADSGRVEMGGRISPFLELGVGFNPELTARENVFLSGSVLGLTRRELEGRVDSIIAFADIGEFAETKLKNFSSGMQVRLAFSVAIQADAGILLMDEVLAVGDVRFQEKCFEIFEQYKHQKRTVVLVTHDLVSVHKHCDRVVMLEHGRVAADGSPQEVTSLYRRSMGVAQAEPDTDAGEPPVALPDDVERHGSREVSVVSVRLLDEQGRRESTFFTGRPMSVEITYRANALIDGFLCRVAFERDDGLPLAWPSTGTHGMVLPCPPRGREGVVCYHLDRVPFCAQSATVGVDLLDRAGGHFYDHVGRAAALRVVDELDRLGIVDPQGTWDLPPPGDHAERPVTT